MNGRIIHNCMDCETRIEKVLDGQCNGQEKNYFLSHIEHCPRCMGKYQREQSFREFLQNKIPQKKFSDSLLSNIRSKIRQQI